MSKMSASKFSMPLIWLAIIVTILCLNRTSNSQLTIGPPGQSKPEMYLKIHNTLRQRVGASQLVWNDTLAERAHNFTVLRPDCRDPPSYEPDINFFFSPRTSSEEAARMYFNAMDWESYGFVEATQSCDKLYPCVSFQKIARLNVTSVGCANNPCDARGTLILCYFSPLLVARKGLGSDQPQQQPQLDPQKYVFGFNELRARKQVGPLVWDEALAEKARAFTEERRGPMGCEGVTDQDPPMDQYVFFSAKDDNPDEALLFMFNSIGWEGYAYDPQKLTCPDGLQCEHFQRVASPDSQRVGCADTQCVGAVGTLIVCHFDPPAKRP